MAELHEYFAYNHITGEFIRKKSISTAKAGDLATSSNGRCGYLKMRLKNKTCLAHRVAWFMYHGEWPSNELDHINGNKADNRIDNLREATPSQNGMNKSLQSNNKSGYRGVFWSEKDKRWIARIKINGSQIELGRSKDINDVIKLRLDKEVELFGGYRYGQAR